MTLSANASKSNPVFNAVLEKYFSGVPDKKTLELINQDLK